MSTADRKLRIFLCHASLDKPKINDLYNRLNSEDWIDPWLDIDKLLPGQEWRVAIEEAVESADIVIICLSDNSVNKEGFIQKELRYAREIALEKPEDTIFLIPLRLDNSETPRGLRSFQWADYFGKNKEKNYKNLLESLKIRHKQVLDREIKEQVQALEKISRKKEELAHKRAEQKIRRDAIKKTRQEAELREKLEREELVRQRIEEKQHFEAEISKREELVRLHMEEKQLLETALREKENLEHRRIEEIALLEKERLEKLKRDDLERKELEERVRREANEKVKFVEDKMLKETSEKASLMEQLAFARLQEKEQREQESIFSKNMPFKKIAYNSLAIGVVALVLMPFGIINPFLAFFLPPFVGGIITGFRLLLVIPSSSKRLAIKIGVLGGALSGIPIAVIFTIGSFFWGIFIAILTIPVGMLGGWISSYFLLRKSDAMKLDSEVKKITDWATTLSNKIFYIILRLAAPFLVSYVFSIFSWLLVIKQQFGFSTDLTRLIESRGTEMALMNAAMFSIISALFGIPYFYYLIKKKSKNLVINGGQEKESLFDGFGCWWLFSLWPIKVIASLGMYLYLGRPLVSNLYYGIGIVFHPLFLVALDFLKNNTFIAIILFIVEFFVLTILDLVYLVSIPSFFIEFDENANSVEKASTNIGDVSSKT